MTNVMATISKKPEKIFDPVDVFISYRRMGGATAASFLATEMKARGLSVFMDVESLAVGDFEQAIVDSISAASNFVLIVTEQVFESVHVTREIEVALSLALVEDALRPLQIIPVFVNGLTDFPQNMPSSLEALRKQNAVSLNHVAFGESLDKLFGWLITRHNQFIDAWVSYRNKSYGEKPLDFLLDNLIEVFPATKPAIETFLVRKYRQQWINSSRNTRKAISDLVNSIEIYYVKEFLEKLQIEHRGSAKLIKKHIECWLSNQPSANLEEGDDRYYLLAEHIKSAVFTTKSKQKELNDLCHTLEIDLSESDRRSSSDVLFAVFAQSQNENVTDILAKLNLNAADISAITRSIWGTTTGTKGEQLKDLEKWVDYRL